ncbi:hypothetical protein [Sphingobacterium cellulitidis]|uniref:hypothetical protein n=1 Tax=Sphingobacterium cellulitidis TaxID=1768011 RepID=UPI003C7D5DE8
MKRIIKLKGMFAMLIMLVGLATIVTSCSKDDDNPDTGGGNIDAAVGTYKGTIKIIGGDDKYNELVEVTKVSNDKLKITAKNSSLNLPVKEVQVYNNAGQGILTTSTEPNGIFIYTVSNKAVSFVAKVTSEGEKMYSFEGTKQ